MSDCIIEIPAELFAIAESSHFSGTLDIDAIESAYDRYALEAPIAWDVDVTNTGEAFLVTGFARADAVCACARCLDDVPYALEGQIDGYFIIERDTEQPEDMESDEFDYLPDDKRIDLEPLIRAALLIELPLVPLCSDDCKGLCPHCGANLNVEQCDCAQKAEAEAAAEDEAANPFAKLKQLKFD